MIEVTVRMYTAKSPFPVYWGNASQQYGAFLIPRHDNSGFEKVDGRKIPPSWKIQFCPVETPKIAPKPYSRNWLETFPYFSKKCKRKGGVRDTPYA